MSHANYCAGGFKEKIFSNWSGFPNDFNVAIRGENSHQMVQFATETYHTKQIQHCHKIYNFDNKLT